MRYATPQNLESNLSLVTGLSSLRLMIVAGEAGGDRHGPALALALRRLYPETTLELFGAGGDATLSACWATSHSKSSFTRAKAWRSNTSATRSSARYVAPRAAKRSVSDITLTRRARSSRCCPAAATKRFTTTSPSCLKRRG